MPEKLKGLPDSYANLEIFVKNRKGDRLTSHFYYGVSLGARSRLLESFRQVDLPPDLFKQILLHVRRRFIHKEQLCSDLLCID